MIFDTSSTNMYVYICSVEIMCIYIYIFYLTFGPKLLNVQKSIFLFTVVFRASSQFLRTAFVTLLFRASTFVLPRQHFVIIFVHFTRYLIVSIIKFLT